MRLDLCRVRTLQSLIYRRLVAWLALFYKVHKTLVGVAVGSIEADCRKATKSQTCFLFGMFSLPVSQFCIATN